MNILSAVIVILLVYLYIKKRLEYESSHDLLTDIYNKRSFERIIEYTVEHARRYNRPLSLILFDIDRFKNINDMYGHKTGDKVLAKLAALIKNSIRKCDTFFRVGGEEFAIICGETTAEDAFKLAEKLRKIVENNNFDDVGRVTISLGIAEMQKGCSIEELYRNADVAMYFAKRNGRNMSKIYSDDINSTFVQKKCVC
jgi:diguanylate cyclase (GGDEF)-like protein